MPNINRIRIINFSYNHDTRHIVDETFNFHGGENALLSLSNGGGKSVLVQLFLQVIVPGARIQGRNIASFFRKKSQPTYIMIEWKLDGGGGYLLTGIGITSAEAAEGEGAKPQIRYFNFTSQYRGATSYDIMHIPVATRNGGVLELKPFREARKILAEQARKNSYLFGYYPEDERNGYARRLAEFGISQDEWRNVITRINDSENGLEDLFQKYRSSSQLLDDWIIKTVEKVMFKGRSHQRQLEEMLEGLVQEVIENERFIAEKQLYSGFLGRVQNILGELEKLLKNLEAQKGLAAKLAALHLYLGQKIKELEEQKEVNEQAIREAREEKQRLNLEERSHQYQICLEEHLHRNVGMAQVNVEQFPAGH
jgi:flagellin-specific chaperone FliS